MNDNDVKFKKNSDSKYKGLITSRKVKSFWKILLDYMYIGFNEEKNDIIKTDFGNDAISFFERFQLDSHGLFRALIMGIVMDCQRPIIRLTAMYPIIDFSLINLVPVVNKKYQMGTLSGNILRTKSDSHCVLEILENFHTFLESVGVVSNLNSMKCVRMIDNQKYTYDEIIELLGSQDKYSQELRKKTMEDNRKKLIDGLVKKLAGCCLQSCYGHVNEIKKWCDGYGLNFEIMMKYFSNYIVLESFVYRNMTDEFMELVTRIKKNLSSADLFRERQVDLIDFCLLFGFPLNICKKIDNSQYYLSLYTPILTNALQLQSISPYKIIYTTFVNKMYLQEYLLYLNIKIDTDSINAVHYITPKLITMFGHIYSSKHFKQMKPNEREIQRFISDKVGRYEIMKNKNILGSDPQHAIVGYKSTIDCIKRDCEPLCTNDTIRFIESFDAKLKPYMETCIVDGRDTELCNHDNADF